MATQFVTNNCPKSYQQNGSPLLLSGSSLTAPRLSTLLSKLSQYSTVSPVNKFLLVYENESLYWSPKYLLLTFARQSEGKSYDEPGGVPMGPPLLEAAMSVWANRLGDLDAIHMDA